MKTISWIMLILVSGIYTTLLFASDDPNKTSTKDANSVTFSYSSLPPYYQVRDKEGRLGPPEQEVVFGEELQNQHKLTADAKGKTLECPPMWQDVAYFLEADGKRGRRIAIFGYKGCPFTLEDDLKVITNIEMRVEKKIMIDSASGNVLWVDKESTRPLANIGTSLAGGCEMLVNMVWVFKDKDITFTTKSNRYQVEKPGAIIKFTQQGIVLDGVKKIAKDESDSTLKDGFLEKTYTISFTDADHAEFELSKKWLSIRLTKIPKGYIRLHGVGDEKSEFQMEQKGGLVEIKLVENADKYVTVGIKVDDGNIEVSQKLHDRFQKILEDASKTK